ncbi:MAG: helicase [Ideonella sp. MAG2]|nr:MAG: helicase [Ideonella sp. MAG2]
MSSDSPRAVRLPDARHLARVPAHISPESLERIRQAAYNLPQVLKPGDLQPDDAAEAERTLDTMGLILLQKAVAHQRPSRWIAPSLLEAALRHLDEVGVGRETRALMLERTGTLEAQGLSRRVDGWERLVRQALPVQHPAWLRASGTAAQAASVAFRAAADSEPVWTFFRTGDVRVLLAQLGPAPAYPQAQALAAHLDALVERGAQQDASQLSSLIARLQAECARPQAFEGLLAACGRAQERWSHQVAEQHTLSRLNQELAFQGYPDSFEQARRLQRKVTLFVGPPNSGKTYHAFEKLAGALDGAYLAPLRLLALEGRDRLVARGVPCSLLTGEERVPVDGARAVSSTIEMVNTREVIDVAVIDEAQMIFDPSRGWAWTQAIVGVPARELIIICSAYAVPAIESLLGLCGEAVSVQHFERKQQVQLLRSPVPIAALKKGDAVVAFSRREVLMLRDQIAANGHPVSVVYGALPPEVRRREAERFASGESHLLVATDAIGMGLNLPIRRVLFSTLTKFDGVGDRPLNESEVHQIAGRAGRFGIHEEGFTGVLHEAEPTAMRTLRDLLPRTPKAPRNFKAPVAPNWWHVSTIASRLGKSKLHEVLTVFMEQLRLDNAHFQVAELEGSMEQSLRACTLWLWLDLRFPGIYGHLDEVLNLRNRLNDGIERHLKGKRPLWQSRGKKR